MLSFFSEFDYNERKTARLEVLKEDEQWNLIMTRTESGLQMKTEMQ